MDKRELMNRALEARRNSYAPYSNFNVGAAVLCDDGSVFKGANIENASYPAGICAERSAMSAAVSSGKRRFEAIAVCGGPGNEKDDLSGYAMPCGICRQVMREFSDPETFRIYVGRSADDIKEFTLSELLPESFGPDHLN